MSNDLEDLVDYSLDEIPDHEMESVSGQAEHDPEPDLDEPLPSDNELRLAQRVLELERERDGLAAQVRQHHALYPAHSTSIPVAEGETSPGAVPESGGSTGPSAPIYIPSNLIPVLALLRSHIQELSRDNAALRYTFLGNAARPVGPLSPGSSIATTPVPIDSPQQGETATLPLALPVPSVGGAGARPASTAPSAPSALSDGVDLAAVVERVRSLILENDELGDMVAEAGRVDGDEWLRTLEESKAMIETLDSDLAHNLTVVEELRAELDAYKERFGPLDGPRPRGDRGDARDRGERGDDRGKRREGDRQRGGGGGGGGGGGAGQRNARRNGRPEDLYRPASGDADPREPRPPRDRDRERERRDGDWVDRGHDRERDRERDRTFDRPPRGDRDRDRGEHDRRGGRGKGGGGDKSGGAGGGGGGPGGISILGRANDRRDEDRASKRRR